MQKPKCRLCGHAHYASEPHVFDDVVVNILKVVNRTVVVNRSAGGGTRSKDRHKDTPARRQYMREYMRTYRSRTGQTVAK